jgi:hypothetical protein
MDSAEKFDFQRISHENARIFQKIFDITPKQWDFYCKFRRARMEGACVSYINNKIETSKDRSLVQRNLQVLLKNELVNRRKMTLAEYQTECKKMAIMNPDSNYDRGSLYFYIPLSDIELIKLAKRKIKEWDLSLDQFLNEIQSDQ